MQDQELYFILTLPFPGSRKAAGIMHAILQYSPILQEMKTPIYILCNQKRAVPAYLQGLPGIFIIPDPAWRHAAKLGAFKTKHVFGRTQTTCMMYLFLFHGKVQEDCLHRITLQSLPRILKKAARIRFKILCSQIDTIASDKSSLTAGSSASAPENMLFED